ncbi:uncharacterized protein LOC128554493 [Mercenaria mercenaria]|uniref:uncharacterized protein LOC128554493 n=1 Tax=Mercenaria mercenaria TaxID=6596 RepID=UPI00234F01A0|nr:uncharacterized protein LOC128554493 [Mercenaria mercenaria]
MNKLIECLGESDPEFLDTAIDEDFQLNFEVENCIIDLDILKESLSLKSVSNTANDSQETSPEINRLVHVQEQMQRLMESQSEQQCKLFAHIARTESTHKSSVKLPKLDLNVFYGNKIQWCEFWDAFECAVHRNTNLSDIGKFTYLQSKLGGEAKRSIAGLTLSNENYAVAIGILHDRYGKKQEIIELY